MADSWPGRQLVRRLPGYRTVHLLLDLLRSAEQRRSALLRLRAQPGLFQPFGTTFYGRYPGTFHYLREALGEHTPAKILSFGCSTGEEVATLRHYLPNAIVTGMDISPERIAICRANLSEVDTPRTFFEVGDTARGEPDAKFDAVLAMSVFRHGQLGDFAVQRNLVLDFDRFEREVGELARALRPGGFLAIHNANFRFQDTVAAAGFEPVLHETCGTPLFGRDGRRLPDQAMEAVVFRKA